MIGLQVSNIWTPSYLVYLKNEVQLHQNHLVEYKHQALEFLYQIINCKIIELPALLEKNLSFVSICLGLRGKILTPPGVLKFDNM